MKNEKRSRDHVSFKETASQFKAGVSDCLILFKEWITDYGRVILPLVLLICIGATVLISLTARSNVLAAEKEAEEALLESKTEVAEVVEIDFEVNAYPEINEMFVNYYKALGAGDIDALEDIQGVVSDTERLRLQAMGPYIDRYDNVCVYTKPGPYLDTYIAYVTVDVYLKETNVSTPGLQGFYVCKTDEGFYYINTAELSQEESAYIENVVSQADVIDLQNTINVQYAELMDENEELKEYWAQISVEIDSSVGETLTEEAVAQAKLEEEEEARRQAEAENDPENGEAKEEQSKVIRVKTTERVNVRKSSSVTADRVGTASEGAVYLALEVMPNGWTKIDFDGTEAYIKSEYLTEIEDADSYETASYIIAVSALNVRSSPSATAEKLGILSEGDTAELIEEADGWSKIKYNGSVAYVKTEYTEKK